jgi:hypothetical protein
MEQELRRKEMAVLMERETVKQRIDDLSEGAFLQVRAIVLGDAQKAETSAEERLQSFNGLLNTLQRPHTVMDDFFDYKEELGRISDKREKSTEFLDHPWAVPGFKPLSREEIYDRA